MPALAISVVIPALNEGSSLKRALDSTRAAGVERIVVDGGSTDGTLETARACGAERVLCSETGRARQMDAGYRSASGDVVMFVHADTRLEEGWKGALLGALEDPRVVGGAFALRFESPHPVYRWIERGARLRARVAGLPYGDQGIFVRRSILDRRGGIPDTPIFEDLDLVRAARRQGHFVLLPLPAWTSPRRYERNGPIATVGRNALALGAYLLHLDRDRVARWYHRRPER